MQHRAWYLILGVVLALSCAAVAGDKPSAPSVPAANSAFDKVVDKVIARENGNIKALRHYTPIVETYLQYMQPDHELGTVPFGDEYFLDRIGFGTTLENLSFHERPGLFHRLTHPFSHGGGDRADFDPQGFAWMSVIDLRGLDRANYQFDYQGREFLGELRCIVIDVTPRSKKPEGRFLGRIWVEDRDFNIVRFNGTFSESSHGQYLHLDTWRLNMAPGAWLPAYIYTEDKLPSVSRVKGATFKGVTRLWGYNVGKGHAEKEFTEVLVDDPNTAKDASDSAQDMTPVAAERTWLRQAEDNVIERLEQGGLLARSGEVDKVLNTVVNNLEITNNLDIQPEVRCRVLLTSPIESFSVGHTIFISRGMLDVLPDEASLAAVLSHELAHIALGHPTDTTFAYKDRSIVSDQKLLARMHFHRTLDEEHEADTKALELLQNSPYRDKLGDVGLFLRQVDARRAVLPHLIQAEMGNSMSSGVNDLRLRSLTAQAPQLTPHKVTQIAALPLGGRIHVDPFNNQIEINRAKAVQLLTAREKMPFEITPIFPHLTRLSDDQQAGAKPASAAPSAAAPDATAASRNVASPEAAATATETR
ncbi:MAG: M48 family metalloprotease [Acidobacteriota bacterium]|nr:M48 family metalloprotease [Acidobacteriota bacterium]